MYQVLILLLDTSLKLHSSALYWLLPSQIDLLIPEFLYRQKPVRHEPNDLNESISFYSGMGYKL